jgi:sensor histidine kinase YesM
LILRISDRLKQTEEARRKAELSYLQAQINPHFLFNTLNSIYSLSIEKSDQVADAVVKLSNMMRYVLTEANKPLVSLKKEIDYINGYIDLQKYRVSNTVDIHLTINGEATHQEIAPLLLITFIENAFKYGVNPEVPSEIIIEIDIGTDDMHLLVKNKKATIKNTERTGLGIKNVKQRLEMLYPGKHTLTVHDGTSDFSVSLLINFK